MKIGLINEGKYPPDNRVALVPAQCRWLINNRPGLKIVVESSVSRCYSDREYKAAGVEVITNLDDCDIMLGIKEVPSTKLIAGKTYCFFSHTKKKQPHNREMLQSVLEKNITLIDYECLEHPDGQRIIGFGFFAGVVGAHNGIMAYGLRTGKYNLGRVHLQRSFRQLIHTYFGLKLPPVKIAVTGSGRVASGILEIMNLMGVIEVEPDEFLSREFVYPVYVHLKGADLYEDAVSGKYNRDAFHAEPFKFKSRFRPYIFHADILMNGVYWDTGIPRLFEWEDLANPAMRLKTIADVTDDFNGSIPCNIGDATITDPIYGVDKISGQKAAPFLHGSIDIMAVSNLPNELPRDASQYFGEQLIKFVIDELIGESGTAIEQAIIAREGKLTAPYHYLSDYVQVHR